MGWASPDVTDSMATALHHPVVHVRQVLGDRLEQFSLQEKQLVPVCWQMLTRLPVMITWCYRYILDHYVVHLKQI